MLINLFTGILLLAMGRAGILTNIDENPCSKLGTIKIVWSLIIIH